MPTCATPVLRPVFGAFGALRLVQVLALALPMAWTLVLLERRWQWPAWMVAALLFVVLSLTALTWAEGHPWWLPAVGLGHGLVAMGAAILLRRHDQAWLPALYPFGWLLVQSAWFGTGWLLLEGGLLALAGGVLCSWWRTRRGVGAAAPALQPADAVGP